MNIRYQVAVLFLLLSLCIIPARASEIHDSVSMGELAEVKRLISANPNLLEAKDLKGRTPLHLAAFWGEKDIVKFLMSKGANAQARDKSGKTPLDIAREKGYKEVAQIIENPPSASDSPTVTTSGESSSSGSEPKKAVADFFSYLQNKEYQGAWNILTEKSRRRICELIAEKTKLQYDYIRGQMDDTDSEISLAFWNTFRDKMKTVYETGKITGVEKAGQNPALVIVEFDGKRLPMKVFNEDGQWKIGWMEMTNL